MRRGTAFSVSASLIIAIIAVGCSTDSPSAPMSPTAAVHSSSGTSGKVATKMTELKRSTSLRSNVSVTANIGPLGGVLLLPEAGLTVVVPPLAVSKVTTFTISAHSGKSLEYDFSPAGTVFTVPLVATQDLSGTEAKHDGTINPLALSVGYYPDPTLPANVTELLNVNVNLAKQSSTFLIWHFSGYMFATGRSTAANEEF